MGNKEEKNEDVVTTEAGEVVETSLAEVEDDEENLVIEFKKPYTFEGIEYTQIDLNGLDNMSAADMIAVNKMMARTSTGIDVMPEVSLEYAINLASRATKIPVEFFMRLTPRDAMRVKNRVMGFLFGLD